MPPRLLGEWPGIWPSPPGTPTTPTRRWIASSTSSRKSADPNCSTTLATTSRPLSPSGWEDPDGGRRAAVDVMLGTHTVRDLIKRGVMVWRPQEIMEKSRALGMVTFDGKPCSIWWSRGDRRGGGGEERGLPEQPAPQDQAVAGEGTDRQQRGGHFGAWSPPMEAHHLAQPLPRPQLHPAPLHRGAFFTSLTCPHLGQLSPSRQLSSLRMTTGAGLCPQPGEKELKTLRTGLKGGTISRRSYQ